MSHHAYINELEDAAANIGTRARADLQILLRRAALRLRNAAAVPLDPEWELCLRDISIEKGMTRNDLIRQIVQKWLVDNSYMPFRLEPDESDQDLHLDI